MSIAERVRHTIWPRRGVAGHLGYCALRPLSSVFAVGVGLRGLGYRFGILHAGQAPVPVVSVGNLAVGGTGKTPFTLWLAEALSARGARPAIVSRGYGGQQSRGAVVVSCGAGPCMGPDIAGDEPVMLAKSFAGPVIVAPRRLDGARAAAALGCDVVVLDDGFQHRALARAFDIVLLDRRRGPLLPAGPLREPLRALSRADAIVLMGRDDLEAPAPPRGVRAPVFPARLHGVGVVESVGGVWHVRPMNVLAGRRVVTVTGVAQPQAFYAQLRRWEAVIEEVFEFPDHHRYTSQDWQRFARRGLDVDLIVTTEKDLVKLETFPFATGKLVALRIAVQVEHAAALLDAVATRIGLAGGPAEEALDGHQ
ncbi:MAG: tetraacyldisaccharide 4'-kinase [Candidatus Binatia bacterium]